MQLQHSRKVVLITGASSGAGEATARLLAQHGMHVVLGARRAYKLALLAAEIRAAGGSADFRALDVTDADDVQTFVLAAHRQHGRVDVLINSAGAAPLSRLDALKLKEWDRMLDVNVRGVLYAIAAVLPLMQLRRVGQIINLAPTSAEMVRPAAAVYSATACAVAAISEGLQQEVGDAIRVTLVSPAASEARVMDGKVVLAPDLFARAILASILAANEQSADSVDAADGGDAGEYALRLAASRH